VEVNRYHLIAKLRNSAALRDCIYMKNSIVQLFITLFAICVDVLLIYW